MVCLWRAPLHWSVVISQCAEQLINYNSDGSAMAKYLARTCLKCSGYLGVVVSESLEATEIRPMVGRCARCKYTFKWTVVVGKARPTSHKVRNP